MAASSPTDADLAEIAACSPQSTTAYTDLRYRRNLAEMVFMHNPCKTYHLRFLWADFRLQLLRWWTCKHTRATPWVSLQILIATLFRVRSYKRQD